MKRLYIATPLAFALLLFMALAMGCDSDFVKTSYRTLETAQIAYDTSMKVVAEAHERGQITDAQADKVVAAGKVFYTTWMAASTALKSYVKVKDDETKDAIVRLLAEMLVNFDKYKAVVTELIAAYKMPEVTR